MTFSEFWPYYLSEHSRTGTKICHFIGTSLLILLMLAAAVLRLPFLILAGIVSAYGFAWTGHFFIERNRPATFRYPFLSLLGDFKMCFLILTGKIRLSADVSSGTR